MAITNRVGPSTDSKLRCFGCVHLDTWWNGGPNLHAKCEKKDRFIEGKHGPGRVAEIRTPDWCPCKQNVGVSGLNGQTGE